MNQPSFSIIVPIYGVEKYIERCARSLFCQKYERIQFIFVNDGTKDRSIEILKALIDKEFAQLREKIVIIDKENGGLPAARKTGLEYATGDYILHVDSDDYLGDSAIVKLAETIENSGADYINFGFQKEYADRISVKRCKNTYRKEEYRLKMISGKAFPSVWSKCISRSLYENQLCYPKYSYGEDLILTLQLSFYAEKIVWLDEILYHYEKGNPGAITAQQKARSHSQACNNLLDLYNFYGGKTVGTPLETITPSLMFRVGWYTVVNKLDFFDTHPELIEYLHAAPLGKGYYIPVPLQLYLKFYLNFFCKKH